MSAPWPPSNLNGVILIDAASRGPGDPNMKSRRISLALSALALAAASFTANADILFQNLGTSAPPASIGGHAVTPFDQAAQAAIANGTYVSSIPGGPNGSSVGISPTAGKRSIGSGWATWSHGYTGAVYTDYESTQVTLTLPAGTEAFYVYVEPDPFDIFAITATSNSGATSGGIMVNGSAGANGYAFYSTAGESITSITISSSVDFAFGEFGISGGTTCASSGYTGTQLTWCQNICEKGYTGATLSTWIRRWLGRWHDLPYCANTTPPPPPQGG